MRYIETQSYDAAFHFSVEEYLLGQGRPAMMLWQTDNCAMLGANQVAQAEIDLRFAEQQGIQIVRRASGGGTIFTDMGTLLYTMILPQDSDRSPMEQAREQVAGPVAQALNRMRVDAKIEGRNDILVAGKKISGFAQYMRRGWVCTHGSLLYDTNLDMLARVLRVDDEKIRSKALKSVRSRVTNIKEHMPGAGSTQVFLQTLKAELFARQGAELYTLTQDDLLQVDEIYRAQYGNPAWTYERAPKFSCHAAKRFVGGKVEFYFEIERGLVETSAIRGDFLSIVPIAGLEQALVGAQFTPQGMAKRLGEIDLKPYLGNISKEEVLACLFGQGSAA